MFGRKRNLFKPLGVVAPGKERLGNLQCPEGSKFGGISCSEPVVADVVQDLTLGLVESSTSDSGFPVVASTSDVTPSDRCLPESNVRSPSDTAASDNGISHTAVCSSFNRKFSTPADVSEVSQLAQTHVAQNNIPEPSVSCDSGLAAVGALLLNATSVADDFDTDTGDALSNAVVVTARDSFAESDRSDNDDVLSVADDSAPSELFNLDARASTADSMPLPSLNRSIQQNRSTESEAAKLIRRHNNDGITDRFRRPSSASSKASSAKASANRPTTSSADRSNVTMSDLVNWSAKENAQRLSQTRSESDLRSLVPKVIGSLPSTSSSSVVEDSTAAPQVRVGPTGELIVDENSLTIGQTKSQTPVSLVNETRGRSAASLSKKTSQTRLWTADETEIFYDLLNAIGTDFSLMKEFFPSRTRQELKRKYKREEFCNRAKIDAVLSNRRPLDNQQYQKLVERRQKELRDEAMQYHQSETINSVVDTVLTTAPEDLIPLNPAPTMSPKKHRTAKHCARSAESKLLSCPSELCNGFKGLPKDKAASPEEISKKRPRKRQAAGSSGVDYEDSYETEAKRVLTELLTIDSVISAVALDGAAFLPKGKKPRIPKSKKAQRESVSALLPPPLVAARSDINADTSHTSTVQSPVQGLTIAPLLQLQLPSGVSKIQILPQSALANNSLNVDALAPGQVVLVHEKASDPSQPDFIHVYMLSVAADSSSAAEPSGSSSSTLGSAQQELASIASL